MEDKAEKIIAFVIVMIIAAVVISIWYYFGLDKMLWPSIVLTIIGLIYFVRRR